SLDLVSATGEVDRHLFARNRDPHADTQRLVGDSVVVHEVLEFVDTVSQAAEACANESFGVVGRLLHRALQSSDAVAINPPIHSWTTDVERGDRRLQVS